eukprot:3525865-Rhodomonas_salina.2
MRMKERKKTAAPVSMLAPGSESSCCIRSTHPSIVVTVNICGSAAKPSVLRAQDWGSCSGCEGCRVWTAALDRDEGGGERAKVGLRAALEEGDAENGVDSDDEEDHPERVQHRQPPSPPSSPSSTRARPRPHRVFVRIASIARHLDCPGAL